MSRNVVAVQLGMQLGMDSIANLAHRMGLNSVIAPYPSSAIGASAVQPLDMVSVYTTFANLGTPVEPRFIYRIEDKNRKVMMTREVRALAPALDPRVTYVVRDMMRDVVERGTASSIRRYLPASIPVAGKTGTAERGPQGDQSWYVVIAPYNDPRIVVAVTIERGGFGAEAAAPAARRILAAYFGIKGKKAVGTAGTAPN